MVSLLGNIQSRNFLLCQKGQQALLNLDHLVVYYCLPLSKVLRVISRTSVEQYRNTTKSIPEIAKELGVKYIVEGSGQKYSNTFRLRVQLVRADKESHLWAKSYEQENPEVNYSVPRLSLTTTFLARLSILTFPLTMLSDAINRETFSPTVICGLFAIKLHERIMAEPPFT
jgi:hypothetical protein